MEGSGPPQKRLRMGGHGSGDPTDGECHKFNTPEGCPYGDRCRFRHPTSQGEDARQDGAGPQPPAPGSRSKACTKFFSTSGCPYGDNCHFLHYVPGGPNAVAQALAAAQNGKGSGLVDAGSNLGGYKSRLCNRYREPGGCRFGEKCHFAHGEYELQPGDLTLGGDIHGGVWQTGRGGSGSALGGQFGGMLGGGRENGRGLFPLGAGPEMSSSMSAAVSFGQSTTTKISIDASLVGAIIGKAGANVKQICKLTGAKLSVRDHETDTNLRNVEMEGSLEQIEKASSMVRQFLMQRDLTPSKPSGLGPHNYKMKMCENFPGGTCTFGDRCHFAHGAHELKDPPPDARGAGGVGGAGGGMLGGSLSKTIGTVM
ncbi:hypothetical protein CBR_g23661 [Chara braunii]|uniref:C3H1-type domain-containing protein n=1 Tax=Chara braunii TaxID=69332 RepID=A0A388L4U2_CHABU|nr:hypothetical protein CBR_g23661 [Chara braunii]|eukprot:GBG77330.1 hypothetical protein CBR_g23661 [Chara braunii]